MHPKGVSLLRRFVGIGLDEATPDHSTISRTRRRLDVETHREMFVWVLGLLTDHRLPGTMNEPTGQPANIDMYQSSLQSECTPLVSAFSRPAPRSTMKRRTQILANALITPDIAKIGAKTTALTHLL
jgi:hypothetical protein